MQFYLPCMYKMSIMYIQLVSRDRDACLGACQVVGSPVAR